jgi:uncharacterized protein DUF6473
MGYQERDFEIVDYQEYQLNNTDFILRGPEPQKLDDYKYFVCVGAAQTYGCFCDKPYPTLLEEEFNIPALNLGFAGAGPYFFLKNDELLKYINNSKFAVIQIMSGRSESNSLFDSAGQEYLTRISDGIKIGADRAYTELIQHNSPRFVKQIIAETRHNWVHNFKALLARIVVPKILLWFSTRRPFYITRYSSLGSLFGGFPQLVNSKMVSQIRKHSDDYVECISRRGMPQLLISRFTGKPTTVDPADARSDLGTGRRQMFNGYYFSPEMQIDSAHVLRAACKKYLLTSNK